MLDVGGRRRVPDPQRIASAAVYGEALLLGQRPEAKALAAELRAFSDGYLDGPALRAEAAGITAGSWYASPASHVGHELIAAGMLILAGGGMARHWTMTSWSGGRGSGTNGDQRHGAESGNSILDSASSSRRGQLSRMHGATPRGHLRERTESEPRAACERRRVHREHRCEGCQGPNIPTEPGRFNSVWAPFRQSDPAHQHFDDGGRGEPGGVAVVQDEDR